jgi:hypothetical protein
MKIDRSNQLPELRADALATHHSGSGYRGVSWDRASVPTRSRDPSAS